MYLGLCGKNLDNSILAKKDAENFDKAFVQPLDYSDNTELIMNLQNLYPYLI